MMTEIVGWSSSSVLLLAIGSQVWRQWRTGAGEGVSSWLYIGQITASAGFTLYSALTGNRVFIVTNTLLLLSALAGLYILLFRCRRGSAAAGKRWAAARTHWAARATAIGAAHGSAAHGRAARRPRCARLARRALPSLGISACGAPRWARAGSRAGSCRRCHRRDPG